jgi:hypothetical protein
LRALLQHKKKTVNFMAAVHRAKRNADKLIQDNEEWIEQVTTRGTEHRRP